MKQSKNCIRCGLVKSAGVHVTGHEYEAPPKEGGFGSKGARLNPRSAKTETYYREERIPEVAEAVGDGRRPCQIKAPGCTGYVEGIHESATRGRFGGLKAGLESGPKFPSCHHCNRYVGEHPAWATEKGFLLSNRGETRRDTQPARRESPAPAQQAQRRHRSRL